MTPLADILAADIPLRENSTRRFNIANSFTVWKSRRRS